MAPCIDKAMANVKELEAKIAALEAANKALEAANKAKSKAPKYGTGAAGTFTMQFGTGQPKWLYLSEAEALFADIENAVKAFEAFKAANLLSLGKDDKRFEASKLEAAIKREAFNKAKEERKAKLDALLAAQQK